MYIHVFLLGIYIYIALLHFSWLWRSVSIELWRLPDLRGLSTVAPHLHLTGTAGGASEMVTRGDLNWMVTIEEV